MLFDELQQVPHFGRRSKWTNIFRPIVDSSSGQEYPGKVFFFDDNEWIGLIIFEFNIVPRFEFFDQGVLQQQRVMLGLNDGKFNMPYLLDEFICFERMVAFGEI
jgi:hypothetical protein